MSGSTAAEYGHLFAVDPATGALTLRQTLDHETAVEYSLSVAASDRGPSATPAFTQVTSHGLIGTQDRPRLFVSTRALPHTLSLH